MNTVLLFSILGLGAGAAYAIYAIGIVATYRGSGTVNFAQGAIGMIAAFEFNRLIDGGMNEYVALVLVILVSFLAGGVWHLGVMRPLRSAPELTKIVCTLGLLGALQGLAFLRYGTENRAARQLLPTDFIDVFGVSFGVDRLYLLGITIVITAVLWAVYKWMQFGIATRAVAESELGLSLLGYSPDVVAASNWAIGFALAAIAGILVAPIVGLNITALILLTLPALAAALIGRFEAFWPTMIAGVLIGSSQAVIGRYWNQPGLTEAIPFVVVVLAMVATGRLIPARGTLGTSRPPLAPGRGIGIIGWIALIAVPIVGIWLTSDIYRSAIATSLITIVVALSVFIVTGLVGQASLMPMTFAGLGGLLTSKFAEDLGLPFPLPMILAAVCMGPIGAILGLPALRVRGLNLAVVTMGAAVAVTAMVFNNTSWTGGIQGSRVPQPQLFGATFGPTSSPIGFGMLCTFVATAMVWLAVNLRKSPLGLRMLAVRSNERAAAIAGVSVAFTKLQAFALSASVAAVAGSLFGYQLGTIAFDRFNVFGSIAILLLVYISGVSIVTGSILAGFIVNGGILYVVMQDRIPSFGEYFTFVSGVLLIITLIANPDGVVIGTRRQLDELRGMRRRRSGTPPPTVAPVASSTPSAAHAANGTGGNGADRTRSSDESVVQRFVDS